MAILQYMKWHTALEKHLLKMYFLLSAKQSAGYM